MTDQQYESLVEAMKPLLARVRRDVTATKTQDGRAYWAKADPERGTQDEPLTRARLLDHFRGVRPRGVAPICPGEATTSVAVLDFDAHGGDTPWQAMLDCAVRVADALVAGGCAPRLYRSSGGSGLHLYLLWEQPQDAYSVRAMLRGVLGGLGLADGAGGVARGQVEVFPKQDSVPLGGFGNQFFLPLFGKSTPISYDPLFATAQVEDRAFELTRPWEFSPPVPVVQRPVEVESVDYDAAPDPIEKVRAALDAIPNEGHGDFADDYDRWLQVVRAVHEATGGSDEGYDAVLEWSERNPKHASDAELHKQWRYLKSPAGRHRATTRATLYYAAQRYGFEEGSTPDAEGFDDVKEDDLQAVNALIVAEKQKESAARQEAKAKWRKALAEATDEVTLQEQVCTGISADKMLDKIDREMLADVLRVRFASFGVKLPIATCRKLLMPARRAEKSQEKADWVSGWVYITDDDKFYRIDSEEFLSAQGFNAKFNRLLPPTPEGELPKSAHRVALDEMQLPTVTRAVYLPWAGPLFDLDGVQCVNLYRPSSTPETARTFTPEGRKAIALVEKHINLIAGGRADVVGVLKAWMAHNVQKPGVKIRWAPLIKGIEGDGKTVIGRVMAAVMGQANVKDISPKVLGTDFTGWAAGACVGVLEEIRLTGHSRHDILNALKPFVTNNTVPIHAKGKDEFTTANTMNYIAFTNHADALPLGDNDRRWWVLFTPFQDVSGLQREVGEVGAYFDALFDGIEQHREELRKWLVEYKIPASFNPNGRAPGTVEKAAMIGLSVSDDEEAVVAALEQKGVGIGEQVLVVSALRTLAKQIDPEIELNTKTAARILSKLGWSKVPKKMKWRGSVCTVWHRGMGMIPTNDEIREALDTTAVDAQGNPLPDDLF